MANADPVAAAENTHPGEFNYLDDHAESSLFRNGKVLTRRDEDGSDAKAPQSSYPDQSQNRPVVPSHLEAS